MESRSEAQAQPQPPPQRPGRRTYVVDRRFQLKYALLLVGVGVLVAGLFGAAMYLSHLEVLRAFTRGEGTAEASRRLFWLMLALSLGMAATLSLVGVIVTHRVAGPVHVMGHYLGVLASGRYPIMRQLRKGDELQSFFQSFQGAVESLRAREVGEADTLREVVAGLSALASTDEAMALLSQLQAMHDRKRDATDRVDVGRTG